MNEGAAPGLALPSMEQLGWQRRTAFGAPVPSGHTVSRVAVEHRGAYELVDAAGEITGALDPAVRRAASAPFDYPTVGDWVVRSLEPRHDRRVAVTDVLDRTSLLCRRAAGPRARPQLVAANADVLAVVTTPAPTGDVVAPATGRRAEPEHRGRLRPASADDAASSALGRSAGPERLSDASAADAAALESADVGHRIEWYLTAAFAGGVQPVIVVNKIDTVSDAECEATVDALRRRLGAAAADVPILTTSALDGRGLEALSALACDGATVALSGPSGVGKSSLVNRLAGADVVPVAPLSPDGRGRHTTVRRQLVPVGGPNGGTFVDTPGLQDLIPWAGELSRVAESAGKLDRGPARGREPGRTSAPGGEQRRPVGATGASGLAMAFRDIAAFAQHCRFNDCAHTVEPGCAVAVAVEDGELVPERLSTYLELVSDMEAGTSFGA